MKQLFGNISTFLKSLLQPSAANDTYNIGGEIKRGTPKYQTEMLEPAEANDMEWQQLTETLLNERLFAIRQLQERLTQGTYTPGAFRIANPYSEFIDFAVKELRAKLMQDRAAVTSELIRFFPVNASSLEYILGLRHEIPAGDIPATELPTLEAFDAGSFQEFFNYAIHKIRALPVSIRVEALNASFTIFRGELQFRIQTLEQEPNGKQRTVLS